MLGERAGYGHDCGQDIDEHEVVESAVVGIEVRLSERSEFICWARLIAEDVGGYELAEETD